MPRGDRTITFKEGGKEPFITFLIEQARDIGICLVLIEHLHGKMADKI